MSESHQRYGPFKRILFCTDFSRNADFAFEFAIEQASRNPDCVLYLLHVIPEPEAQFWRTYIYEVENLDEKAKQDMDAKVAETYLPGIPAGIHYEVEFRIGKDYMQILEFASEKNVDLIIIGRHGQSSFGKVLFGNVTEKVTRHAECPVLVIPLRFEKRTQKSS
ncbi:MAG: universal stress protein [Candidatus Omnitrophota bacterium]|jgi:nucleotide-binding universal stress UspA family protein|nr:MAG: universal stress protein [Candidatus Omnitrophota bacterium]